MNYSINYLGFEPKDLPIYLVDKSYGNDVCPSFYFFANGNYFVLWVEHESKDLREAPECFRYTLVYGMNEGDEDYPEIYDDYDKEVVAESDSFQCIEKAIWDILLGVV